MAKSKSRVRARAEKRARKAEWKRMAPEARKAWELHRKKTAKSGYAKRQRERENGAPMSSRSHESPPWWKFGAGLGRGLA